MMLRCGLLLLFLSCAWTAEYDDGMEDAFTEIQQKYYFWPPMYNALRIHKREAESVVNGLSEGGEVVALAKDPSHNPGGVLPSPAAQPQPQPPQTQPPQPQPPQTQPPQPQQPQPQSPQPQPPQSQPEPQSQSQPQSQPQPQPQPQPPPQPQTSVETTGNHTTNNKENGTNNNSTLQQLPKHLNLNDSRVILRGVIVFGGFMLLAVAYYIFYRKNNTKNETGHSHNTKNDGNQFRYGVLQSEDRRDNLELSRVPLTMESDDDDDEDLEIFDLEQKKKSLSYVNLQTHDEDIVFPQRDNNKSTDKENLLLDIDDTGSETLINWSSNGNKSIL